MNDDSSTLDRALMEALRDGDRRALGTLYDRHATALHTFLLRWTGDSATAEDLMHDTFLRLLRPALSYDGRGRFRTWLYRIARNLATDRFRRAGRWTELGDLPEPVSDRPSPLDDLEALEDRVRLEDALGHLAPGQREVLLLRADLGLSHRELGAELGCSEGAARVRLHRAVAALRRYWLTEVDHA